MVIIAMLNYQFWCPNKKIKNELYKQYLSNNEKYQKEIEEKNNLDAIFKNKKQNSSEEAKYTEENTSMIIIQEEKWYKKIFNRIKNLFKKVK